MKILFCNIAWMKYYSGIRDDDIPYNGGKYVDINKEGGEIYNFQDFNGNCYGYVMLYGNMALEKHFENVSSNQAYIDDVLVIWVATNKNKETRIVGWYKNARVYRESQFEEAFTNWEYNLDYSIKASAKDCYLLDEKDRNFAMPRAAEHGVGKGLGRSNIWYAESDYARNDLIPRVIKYIEDYDGEFINLVVTDELLEQTINNDELKMTYSELMEKGNEFWDKGNDIEALKYYNTARAINETSDVMANIGRSMMGLLSFDRARIILENLLELEGEKKDILIELILIYDLTREHEKTIFYIKKIMEQLGETDEDKETKFTSYMCLFSIYLYKEDIHNANLIIEGIEELQNTKIAEEMGINPSFIGDLKNTVQDLKNR